MGRSYRNVMAIASKELRSSFASPVAWVKASNSVWYQLGEPSCRPSAL